MNYLIFKLERLKVNTQRICFLHVQFYCDKKGGGGNTLGDILEIVGGGKMAEDASQSCKIVQSTLFFNARVGEEITWHMNVGGELIFKNRGKQSESFRVM
jgi:hypothetical protein